MRRRDLRPRGARCSRRAPRWPPATAPPVASCRCASRNGVTALPLHPCAAAPPGPRRGRGRAARGRAARRRRSGWPRTSAPPVPSASWAAQPPPPRACPASTARRSRCRSGRSRGTRRCAKPATLTPSVSSRSSVAPTSRIDFTPAQTTQIGSRASASRSADSSHVSRALAVHAAEAAGGEHADARLRGEVRGGGDRGRPVVRAAAASGRSRTLELRDALAGRQQLQRRVGRGRRRASPSSTAIVAGTAPAARTASSSSRRDLAGCGAAAARGR